MNEQNPQAIAFCEHKGFAAYGSLGIEQKER